MNPIESTSHPEIAHKKERAKEILAQMKRDIAKFAITENNGKYICN